MQKSLSNLTVDGPRPPRRNQFSANRGPEVPDAEFDFSKGTERFEAEREARAGSHLNGKDKIDEGKSETSSGVGTPSQAAQLQQIPSNGDESVVGTGLERKSAAYVKNGFFDGLSGESSRVSRADERHRNLDTFGEAGGGGFDRGGGRGRGGYGYDARGRGGRGGYSGGGGNFDSRGGYGDGGNGDGRNYGGRGGGGNYGGRGGSNRGGEGYRGAGVGFGGRNGYDGRPRGFSNGNGEVGGPSRGGQARGSGFSQLQ